MTAPAPLDLGSDVVTLTAALVDVANNSPVPGARVAAAKTILEMTGFKDLIVESTQARA